MRIARKENRIRNAGVRSQKSEVRIKKSENRKEKMSLSCHSRAGGNPGGNKENIKQEIE